MLEYSVHAVRPAELFLAALAARMLKNLERVAPMPSFRFGGADLRLHGVRQDRPPQITHID